MGTIEKMKQGENLNKPIQTFLIEKHQLQEQSKFNKCPICYKEKVKAGWNFDKIMGDLKNVTYQKVKEVYKNKDGQYYNVFDEYYICNDCGMKLTVEHWRKAYCKGYEGAENEV
ncbi:MAG: hypothetical protein MJ179_02695 [Treponema sp.]|nr:hypothetical protein [Treponema sp.]